MTTEELDLLGLFDNPLYSDVRINQISTDGTMKEYYAHKAVLYPKSKWFRKTFDTQSQEADSKIVTLRDDDPKHFEHLLRCIYAQDIDELSFRAVEYVELYSIADKYGCERVQIFATNSLLPGKLSYELTYEECAQMVETHYSQCPHITCPMGKAIAGLLWYKGFTRKKQCEEVVKKHPEFSAELFAWCRNEKVDIFKFDKPSGQNQQRTTIAPSSLQQHSVLRPGMFDAGRQTVPQSQFPAAPGVPRV